MVRTHFFDLRQRSLARGNVLVLGSLLATMWLSDFPHNRENPLLALPALLAVVGTVDTARCMQKRWSFYHGGIILCLYMDLMALALMVFSLVYPYLMR